MSSGRSGYAVAPADLSGGSLTGMLDVPGYLRRLRVPQPPRPTAEALMAIHRAHVERVAYNTIDIHLARRTTVDPYEAAARIVETGRSGYCFHLNGALGVLLGQLGFDVRRHRGGVCGGPADVPLKPFANHLALTVHGVPSAENPTGDWFVDAGLGDALYEPIALRAGSARQGPFGYELSASAALDGGWRFTHDQVGSFATMDFEARAATAAEFRGSHRSLSTSPQSPFVQCVIAQRRDADGFDKLLGCTLTRVDARGVTATEITDRSDWFAVLGDVFGLPLTDLTGPERDRLWQRAYESHLAWQARHRQSQGEHDRQPQGDHA